MLLGVDTLGHDKRLQLTAVGNGNSLAGGTVSGSDLLDGLDNIETLLDLAEDDVLAVQPAGLDGADEELGAVCVYESGLACGCQ